LDKCEAICLNAPFGVSLVVVVMLSASVSRCHSLLGSRQPLFASVFTTAVIVPLALAGVFPRLFLTFAIIDALLALGAWTLLARE